MINTLDFTFILLHFLRLSEVGCGEACGPPMPVVPIARTTISVTELIDMGLAELVPADLNGDGNLDRKDMSIYVDLGLAEGLGSNGGLDRGR